MSDATTTVDTNTSFKIRKDVTPPRNRGRVRYPWADMEIGDSFVVRRSREGDQDIKKVATSVHSAGYNWCRRNKPEATVTIRTGEDQVEVWMVARNQSRTTVEQPSDTDLPDDFPGAQALVSHGLTTLESVQEAVNEGPLSALKGIGEKTEKAILEALEALEAE